MGAGDPPLISTLIPAHSWMGEDSGLDASNSAGRPWLLRFLPLGLASASAFTHRLQVLALGG